MKNLLRNKKALSPVIATVILVSVTIVVAVSVAYWMGSIAGGYTAFEQIELPTAYAEYDTTLNAWNVTVQLKNSGSADATIELIFLNDKPLDSYGTIQLFFWNESLTPDPDWQEIEQLDQISISVPKGSTAKLTVDISSSTPGCSHGTRIDFKLHSAAGRDYPIQVKLP